MNALENTITTMGLLSQEAYSVGNFKLGTEITANNKKYRVVDYVSTANDFQALLLQNENGNYVIAFRGTTNNIDWLNNASIGFKNINKQYNDAKEFLEKAFIKIAEDKKCFIDEAKNYLTLTGHSLGGILTQQVGATYGIKGYAFNPYGTDRLLSLPESPFDGLGSNFLYGLLTSLAEKVMSAVGLTKTNAQWAYEHIYNISYQDEGAINGDILSNLLTELSSNHLGHFIPIMGKDVQEASDNIFDTVVKGHGMEALNIAIAEYNEIVKKFDNSCRYENITQIYLLTAIIHGNGYKKVQEEFRKLGILNENGANNEIANNSLHLDIITPNSPVTSIFSGSNLSTPSLYALINLNPFIISGINSNAYNEIEQYRDEYSGNYIEDKAKMFSVALGQGNIDGMYYKDYESRKVIVNSNIKPYDDDATNQIFDETIMFGTNLDDKIDNGFGEDNKFYTLAGDDTITLSSGSNYIEAGSGNDYINLSGITDTNSVNTIYADIKDSEDDKGSGNDIIIGSSGKDIMYGGAGNDKYIVGNGDIIEDSDKVGSVEFKGTTLHGGYYDSDTGNYTDGTYDYRPSSSGSLTITHKDSNESITINNFTNDIKIQLLA